LRIAYITPRYYPHLGGVEYVVRNLAERLALKGHDITVITGEPTVGKIVTEEINKVKVVRIPTYAPREAYHIPKDVQTIARILEDNLDIVHTHSVHAMISFLPLRIKKSTKYGWKLIMTMHFSTPGYTFLRRIMWRLVWRRHVAGHLKYVDLIHATSPLEASTILKYFPSVKERIVSIPIGIEEDVLNYKWKGRDSDFLFYSGRLEKYKRVNLAVRAVLRLLEQGYPIRLVVTGSGPYRGKIVKEAVKKLGKVASRFIVVDSPRPREEYLELLSNARAAINLSAAENFNVFLAEAYAIGVPIIATREAAAFYPEIANVEALNVDSIADVILKVLSSQNDSHYKFKPKTWQMVVEELENAYRSVLQK
jgi:glycosyltransferase involved in cell wall biosynthesis